MTDVCLILEETYPYVCGGVSSWVHSLLTGLPDIEFSLIHISADENKPRQAKFDLPPNLRRIAEIGVNGHGGWDETMNRLQGQFEIPQSRVYHALSTGLAGMLGSKIKQQTGRPFILTEHGIYWKEIESGANEVESGFKVIRADGGKALICNSKDHWTATFKELARSAYDSADEVVTVCPANQRLQLTLGLSSRKCSVIPNGVDFSVSLNGLPEQSSPEGRRRIGFVGRIVPLKDIKTLIRACRIVSEQLAEAEFLLIGPTDQDPAYYQECLEMVREVGLSDRLLFIGETDPCRYYPILDVMVLTSISEGQPFAVLEAMSHGVPVVATAVGGCVDLVYGANNDDFKIGAAGIITPCQDPKSTAQAILKICSDRRLATVMSQTAKTRVQTHYSRSRFLQSYRRLYARYGCGRAVSAS